MRFVRWLTSPRGVAVSVGLDVLAIILFVIALTLPLIIGVGETPPLLFVTLGILLVGAVIRAIEGVRKLRSFRRAQSASVEEPPAAS